MTDAPLDQETLARLRHLMTRLKRDGDGALPLVEAAALASSLEESCGITLDLVATQALGQPMVVVRLPDTKPTPAAGKTSGPLEQLSPREWEVALCIAQGMRNKEIAAHLHISLATVKDHVHNMLRKLDVSSRTAIAAMVLGQREE